MNQADNTSKIIVKSMLIIALAYFSQYNFFMCIVAVFLMPAIISSFICNYGLLKAIYTSVSAIIFCILITLTKKENVIFFNAFLLLCILTPGILIGICFEKKRSFSDTLVLNSAFDCFMFFLVLIVVKFVYNTSIADEIQGFFTDTFSDQIMLIKSLYPSYSEHIDEIEHQIFNTIYVALPGIVPFVVAASSIAIFAIKYAICKSACASLMIKKNIFADGFDTFHISVVTDVVLALALIGLFTSTSMKWLMICINIILIILVLAFITFVAIIDFKLKERFHNTSKRIFTLAGIFLLSIAISLFMPVVNFVYVFILFGILDSFFDFRKLACKKGEINEI